jgi:hypothetical protein
MRPTSGFAGLYLASAVLALQPTALFAAIVPALTISDDGNLYDSNEWNVGYSFVADAPTAVLSLGVWDEGSDGLINGHEVGLWDSDETLMAVAFVPPGVAGILDSGFRFVDIAPVPLTPGETYYVAGTYLGPGDDRWSADASTVLTAPGITYESRRYAFGSALAFPGEIGVFDNGYWGGNVRVDAMVPEPSPFIIAALGVCGMVIRRRR